MYCDISRSIILISEKVFRKTLKFLSNRVFINRLSLVVFARLDFMIAKFCQLAMRALIVVILGVPLVKLSNNDGNRDE